VSAPPPADHSAIIAGSILGGAYAIVAISAIVFLLIPRLLANTAAVQAARPAAGVSGVVRAARRQPLGLRWSPAYGGGLARTRTGVYVPREKFEMTRVPAANYRFPPVNKVLLNLVTVTGETGGFRVELSRYKERDVGALEIERAISSLPQCTYFGIEFQMKCRNMCIVKDWRLPCHFLW